MKNHHRPRLVNRPVRGHKKSFSASRKDVARVFPGRLANDMEAGFPPMLGVHRHQLRWTLTFVLWAPGLQASFLRTFATASPSISTAVLDAAPGPSDHPQAHFLQQRITEILRAIDPQLESAARMSAPLEEWRRFIYCHSVAAADDAKLTAVIDHFSRSRADGA